MKKNCCNLLNHGLNFKSKYHTWHWPCICVGVLCSSERTVSVCSLLFFCLQCVFPGSGERNIKPQKLKSMNIGEKWRTSRKDCMIFNGVPERSHQVLPACCFWTCLQDKVSNLKIESLQLQTCEAGTINRSYLLHSPS